MEAEPETKVVPLAEPAVPAGEAGPSLRRRIGRYEILQRLGHGGMATVFLARATGSAGFEKMVAIKVIHPHLAADPDLVDMFLDEARIAARIHNPHVVEILDLGHDRGDYFMVMEAVDGETLSALIRKLRPTADHLPLPVILQILIDACEGLRAAHELRDADGNLYGLIHRDVSPQNLLIDFNGWVRIVDFGIMKAKGRRSDTRTGQLRGKLPYMSPEQAQSKPLTSACDLFALGVILWELCTGARLFAGETDVETLAKVVACERPPLRTVRPDLPSQLERVLERTLARDPAARYPSAAAMLAELRLLLREIGGDVDPRGTLAAAMREHFGEQAEYRRATARASASSRPRIALVHDGDDGGHTRPDAASGGEVPTRRDAPALAVVPIEASGARERAPSLVDLVELSGEPTTAPVTGLTGLTAVPPRTWGVWIVLPLVGAVVAVLTLVASGVLRGPQEPAAERPDASPRAPAIESVAEVVPLAGEPAEATTIRWVINTDPIGASVRITGAADDVQASIDEQLGGKVTPLEVRLPRGDEASLSLLISREGYQAAAERRLPLASENLRYVLRPLADPSLDERRGKTRPVRLTAKAKKPASTGGEDPLPPPTFDKPLKKRVPGGG